MDCKFKTFVQRKTETKVFKVFKHRNSRDCSELYNRYVIVLKNILNFSKSRKPQDPKFWFKSIGNLAQEMDQSTNSTHYSLGLSYRRSEIIVHFG